MSARSPMEIFTKIFITFLEFFRDAHLDTIGKVDYLLINHILDTLNASRIFNFVNTWGYYNKTTQRFNGMVGQLVDGSANIGGTGLFVVQERIRLIEYLSMITPTQSRFVLRAPPLSYVSNIYSLPFSKNLWFYLVILLLLCIISIFIFFKIENFNNVGLPGVGDPRFSDVVLLSFGALCQMGPLIDSRRMSGKIIIVSVRVFQFQLPLYLNSDMFSAIYVHCFCFNLYVVYSKNCSFIAVYQHEY